MRRPPLSPCLGGREDPLCPPETPSIPLFRGKKRESRGLPCNFNYDAKLRQSPVSVVRIVRLACDARTFRGIVGTHGSRLTAHGSQPFPLNRGIEGVSGGLWGSSHGSPRCSVMRRTCLGVKPLEVFS